MSRRSTRREPDPAASLDELRADLRKELPTVLTMNGMGGFLWDLASDLVVLDSGCLAIFDLDPEEYDGRVETLTKCLVPEEIPALRDLLAGALTDRGSHGAYFRIRDFAADLRWAHTQVCVQRDGRGRPRRMVGIVRDASPELQHLTQQAVLEADRKRRSDVVQATTAALSRALTVEDVLTALTSDEIMGAIGAVGMSLSHLEQDRLRWRVSAGLPLEMLRDMEFARLDDRSPIPDAVRTQMPLFLNRKIVQDRYPALWSYVGKTPLTSAAILPLAAQARPTGALMVLYEGKESFSPEDRNLLLALAATVAQSVQRAVLYDQEHALAVGLQQSMLPASISQVTGTRIAVRYRPAHTGHQIGGDWYDVVPLPTGRVGLLVGDVEGHDVHASAVMGQLRTALRAYAAEGHPPAALMARASAFLRDLDTERFATCLYADLDPRTGHARLVRAGHLGPLVRHADGWSSSPRVPGGLPLGLSHYSREPYPTTDLELGPDETLLLCTDGLVEFHGMDLDEGMSQLEAILRSGPADTHRLAEHIVSTIESRRRLEDDAALLLVALVGDRRSEQPPHGSRLDAL